MGDRFNNKNTFSRTHFIKKSATYSYKLVPQSGPYYHRLALGFTVDHWLSQFSTGCHN